MLTICCCSVRRVCGRHYASRSSRPYCAPISSHQAPRRYWLTRVPVEPERRACTSSSCVCRETVCRDSASPLRGLAYLEPHEFARHHLDCRSELILIWLRFWYASEGSSPLIPPLARGGATRWVLVVAMSTVHVVPRRHGYSAGLQACRSGRRPEPRVSPLRARRESPDPERLGGWR